MALFKFNQIYQWIDENDTTSKIELRADLAEYINEVNDEVMVMVMMMIYTLLIAKISPKFVSDKAKERNVTYQVEYRVHIADTFTIFCTLCS